jgi:hypothetical protein
MTSMNNETIEVPISDEMHEAIDALAEFFGITYEQAFSHALFVGIESGFHAADQLMSQPKRRTAASATMRIVQ